MMYGATAFNTNQTVCFDVSNAGNAGSHVRYPRPANRANEVCKLCKTTTCSSGWTKDVNAAAVRCAGTCGGRANDLCCNANPTCNNIDGGDTTFSSCVVGTNTIKAVLTGTCATDTCLASDCCDANPTCNNIDGGDTVFSSCVEGTNTIKSVLTGTCATGTCAASDCCDATATDEVPQVEMVVPSTEEKVNAINNDSVEKAAAVQA